MMQRLTTPENIDALVAGMKITRRISSGGHNYIIHKVDKNLKVVFMLQPDKEILSISSLIKKDWEKDGMQNHQRLLTKKYDEIIKEGTWYSHT